MSSIAFTPQSRTLTVIGLFALILAGCAREDKQSGAGNDEKQADVAKVTAEIRQLLPAAAGMPYREFELMATSSTAPSLEGFENQPLSLVVLMLRGHLLDGSREKLKAEFDYISIGPPKPSDIAEAMSVSRGKDYASVIQPDYIDDLTCDVQDGKASGQVSFTIKDCFKATVQFAAEKRDDKWQITKFSLPVNQATTVLGDDGKWKASGAGVGTLPVYVSLPVVAGFPPREDSPNRLVLYVGRENRAERDQYSVGIGEKKSSLEKARDILAPRLGEFCKHKKIETKDVLCVIRADRKIPTGVVQQVMTHAMETGVEQFRLQARVTTDNMDFDFYPTIGEATFRLPLATTEIEELEFTEELELNSVEPIEISPSLEDVSPRPVEVDIPQLEPALPKPGDCQPKEDWVPPLRVRLQSTEDGSLVQINVEQFSMGSDLDQLQQRLLTFVGEAGVEVAVEIDVDYELRCEEFMKAVAACSGYKQDNGKWVPLIRTLLLAPPRHPEE